MNLAHALVYHPCRDHLVWGVRNRHMLHRDKGDKASYIYATSFGSWSLGRIPHPGMLLRDAVQVYHDSLRTWANTEIYRLYFSEGEAYIISEDLALSEAGYNSIEETRKLYRAAIARGVRLPPEVIAKYAEKQNDKQQYQQQLLQSASI